RTATARRRQVHTVAPAGVAGLAAADARGADADHAFARGHRVVAGVRVAVACGDHDDRTQAVDLVDRILVGGRACGRTDAAQAHVEHFGRILVGGQAIDRATGGPD